MKGTTIPLTFPTQPNASISGNLVTPGFTLADALVVKHAVLLKDGLHVFLALNSYPHGTMSPNPAWAQLSTTERLESLEHNNSSYSARINRAALNYLLQTISTLPINSRTIRFQGTSQNGDFWSYYHPHKTGWITWDVDKANAHLDPPSSLHGSVELSNLSLQFVPNAITGMKVKLTVNVHAQVKGWAELFTDRWRHRYVNWHGHKCRTRRGGRYPIRRRWRH